MNGPGLVAAGLLAARGGDLFTVALVFLFAVVIPLIGWINSKLRESSQPKPPLPLDRNQSGRIQEQIDEFLRRAAQRRAGQPAATPRQPVEVLADDDAPVGGRVAQQSQKYMDMSEFRRRSDELGGDVAQSDRQFTQQVGQAFSGEVGRLASRPGETAQPAEAVEAEVVEEENPQRPRLDALPEAGSGLAALLGSPENIVQSFIMSEILRRPE